MIDYCVVAKSRLDILCKSDLWYRSFLWDTGKLLAQWVQDKPNLSDICCRIFNLSRSEWRRKLNEGAIDFGKNGNLATIRQDVVLETEGYYEIRFGKRSFLAISIPEPWYIGLWLRFAAAWNRTILRKCFGWL